jgi:hypothetical protein
MRVLLPVIMIAAMAAMAAVAGDRTTAIQADVERALARLARIDPARELSYGAIEVVPDGGAYGVTVADVALRLAPGDPGLLDIGIVSFRLSPVDGDVYRIDRVAAAPTFDHRSADGSVDGTWRLASRRLEGLWSRRQGGFLRRGAAVDVDLDVTGLDQAANGIAAAAEAGANMGWLQLMLLRGLARRETAPDGAVVDRYDIEAMAGGPLIINGRSYAVSPAALALP